MKSLIAVILSIASFASAAEVICQARNGVVFARSACRKNETKVDPAAIGLKSPAGCPATLDGKYSGIATTTGNWEGQPTTNLHVMSVVFVGNQVQINAGYDASMLGPVQQSDPQPALPVSYNSSTCVVNVLAPSPLVGVVSDGGNVINLIQGTSPNEFKVASYTFRKQ